ncbi:type I 3-dehydroquinate dehydratase [Alkalihalobacillus sp. FSL W8-0930]
MCAKKVKVNHVTFGAGHKAAICCSLVGATKAQLVDEIKLIQLKKPDVIEWRADFLTELDDPNAVLDVLKSLHEITGETPLLFTIRSDQEGGQPVSLTTFEQKELIQHVLKSGLIQMIDFEVASPFAEDEDLKTLCKDFKIKWIGSTHDFEKTPTREQMLTYLKRGEALGADLVKLAVMPHSREDVLSLFTLTNEATEALTVPVITIAMGSMGVSTRLVGDQFGSVMTFAVGHQASAPGQAPLELIRDIQAYTE